MCTAYDIAQRCIKGNIAFNSFKNVWLQGRRIHLSKLVKIYEAMVVSVILYNCSSWAVNKDILRKLDVCHRNHLRQLLNIKYPTTIRNKKLYEVCGTTPLSLRVTISRWKMFGHILRSPENSPAALALQFALSENSPLKRRVGNHRDNLLKSLQKDLKLIPMDHSSTNIDRHSQLTLTSPRDIVVLRNIANNKREWNNLLNYVARNTSDI